MSPSRTKALTVIATAAAGIAVLLIAAGSDFRAAARKTGEPVPAPSQGRCPTRPPQPLPGDALAGATEAALAQAPSIYHGTKLAGMRATKAVRAPEDDPGRGGYARVTCGRTVQRRSVVVYLRFPAMLPSASLSEGVVLVSRFRDGYRVWAQLH